MIHYSYSTEGLEEGTTFKNFKTFFCAVTGRFPPSGKNNLDTVKATLSRYLEYKLEKDVNPNVKSKQSIIITKIYETPIAVRENRGKKGKYADDLKPLILATGQYEGTTKNLFRQWGILGKYFEENIKYYDTYNTTAQEKLNFDIWNINRQLSAVREYKRILYDNMRAALKRSLKSLQDENVINWSEYHLLIPSAFTDIDGSQLKRPKSIEIINQENEVRQALINEILTDENAVLDPRKLSCLNINSNYWDNSLFSGEEYINEVLIRDMKPFEFRASEKQEQAIFNYELFLRQHTYKEYHKEKYYRPIIDIPNERDFFADEALSTRYNLIKKEFDLILTNCIKSWKEIEFKKVAGQDTIRDILEQPSKSCSEYADALTITLIEYMNSHLEIYKFKLRKKDLDDFKTAIGKGAIGHEYTLTHSKSVCKLHELLKSLYSVE